MGNKHKAKEENKEDNNYNANINNTTKIIHKISLSRMFALNRGPDIADMEKLRYIYNTLGQNAFYN